MTQPRIPWTRLGAEFVVIVVGVLVALGADAWWDSRDDRQRERGYLEALLRELQDAQAEVARDQDGRYRRLARLDSLRARFGQPEPSPDSVAEWTRSASGMLFYLPPSAVFNDLVSSGGLTLIRSRDLRESLMAYDQATNALRRMEEREDSQIQTRFRPYLVDTFWISDEGPPPPALVTRLLNDRRFHNLVTERRGLTETSLRMGARVETTISEAISLIRRELAR